MYSSKTINGNENTFKLFKDDGLIDILCNISDDAIVCARVEMGISDGGTVIGIGCIDNIKHGNKDKTEYLIDIPYVSCVSLKNGDYPIDFVCDFFRIVNIVKPNAMSSIGKYASSQIIQVLNGYDIDVKPTDYSMVYITWDRVLDKVSFTDKDDKQIILKNILDMSTKDILIRNMVCSLLREKDETQNILIDNIYKIEF